MNLKKKQQQPSSTGSGSEFVPEKISINTNRRGRRHGGEGETEAGSSHDHNNSNTMTGEGTHHRQQQAQPTTAQLSASQHSHDSGIASSVVFHEDCELFDEIDKLYPHDYEGGRVVTDPNVSTMSTATSHSDSTLGGSALGGLSSSYGQRAHAVSSLSGSRSTLASSLLQSLQASNLGGNGNVPTDIVESLVASSNDGTLADLIAGIEDRYKGSTTMSQASINGSTTLNYMGKSKRDSIVGGKQMSDMSFKEQRELLAPERSDASLVVDLEGGGEDNGIYASRSNGSEKHTVRYSPTDNVIVSSVDWSSLLKSCKRAKNAFRDTDSGQMVVKNMFSSHLGALTTVLTLYAKRYCGAHGGDDHEYTLDEIMARTKETKRALRFGMSCLAPPRVEEDSPKNDDEGGHDSGPETQDGIEKYRTARVYRQELQDAAVKGFVLRDVGEGGGGGDDRDSRHYYGLQIPLCEIINDDEGMGVIHAAGGKDTYTCNTIVSSIEKEKRAVRVLAARMLCNLVTDNPLAAEIVLRDVPFSPGPDLVEAQLASSILGSRERADMGKIVAEDDKVLFWSDLIASTARVQAGDDAGRVNGNEKKKGDDRTDDREALAAVAAALHNLLTSLEARESLLEFEHEMKRREDTKKEQQRREGQEPSINEDEATSGNMKPIDVGFEVASEGPLLNALLRNILPAKAVLMQSKFEREHREKSRPKFKLPQSANENEELSDSATEWISLILERLASRGLLPNMLRSAGGTKSNCVTPEQVVLVSCIRQAVDDYHSALTPTGETGGFGRRRLSIAAKTAGMTVTTRPHPLWGRADLGGTPARNSRTAVPVLLSLANEVETIRERSDGLREGESSEAYDGEGNCTTRIIDDLCDILAQSLGRHATTSLTNKQGFLADARSVLGRETTLISSCCKDLGRVLDSALAENSGRKAREMMLSSQDQQTTIVMVRMIGNLVYQCRYNQDLLRITPVPMLEILRSKSVPSNPTAAQGNVNSNDAPTERTGLHVILSATSLAPACFTLREWCIVAIRNAVEGNAANAETVRRLEANEVLDDTPELRKIGVKIDMDANGNVQVKRRDP